MIWLKLWLKNVNYIIHVNDIMKWIMSFKYDENNSNDPKISNDYFYKDNMVDVEKIYCK